MTREVADKLRSQTRGQKLVLMKSSELLFLMRHRNLVPNIYMNRAVHSTFRLFPHESVVQVAARLLNSVEPDFFIAPRPITPFVISYGTSYVEQQITSENGKYEITLWVRSVASADP